VFWSTAGSTILSVLQRTIQSLGRSKKVASGGPDDILPDYPQHQSVLVQLTLSGSSKDLASHNGGVQYHDTADNKCVTGDDNNCGARKSSATSCMIEINSTQKD
jgi:hypothetical protein